MRCRRFLLKIVTIFWLLIQHELLIAQQKDTTYAYTGMTQTFTVPAGVTTIYIRLWGGGGNGSNMTGNNLGGGGGGGGGAYVDTNIMVTPLQVYNVQVGQGGGGSGAVRSWFNNPTTVMAEGGSNGANNSSTGAAGGSAASSIGSNKQSGGTGANGDNSSPFDFGGGGGSSAGPGSDGVSGSMSTGGTGPVMGLSGDGGNGRTGSNGSGSPGALPGGGGGGALRQSNSGTTNGGNGADGRVFISYCLPQTEICNDVDDDCDGMIDEGLTFTNYYADTDGDGYGDADGDPHYLCYQPSGTVPNNEDCDDENSSVNPAAQEICGNQVDDNCNDQVDEGCNDPNNAIPAMGEWGVLILSLMVSIVGVVSLKIKRLA